MDQHRILYILYSIYIPLYIMLKLWILWFCWNKVLLH